MSPALGLLAFPAAARATGYDGIQSGHRVSFDTRGGRVTYWSFYDFRYSCSDGTRTSGRMGYASPGEIPVRVGGDGSFDYVTKPHRAGLDRRHPRPGFYRFRMRGRVTRAAVQGTWESRFTRGGLRCTSGRHAFVAYRHGTQRAPLRNARTATGSYGGRAREFADVRLRVLAPRGTVSGLSVRTRTRCAGGGTYTSLITGSQVMATDFIRAGRWFAVARYRGAIRGGRRTDERLEIRGSFSRSGGAYRFRGRITLRARVSQAGRTLDTCSASRPVLLRLAR